ncbi:MAG: PolC-type DNA polymerase III N-terminal domain-containing protein, partial [Blautia coccoides]
MMEKNFLDVFPDLEAGRELSALLEEVVVTKVAVNPEKDHIRIYIRSRQWIHKKYIYSLEETIRNQFFPGVPMSVKIIEKFTLTGQYTPKLFFDAYRTSMSMELKNYSILVYNMFRTAQISFPEEQKMELRMQSSVLAKSREEELVSYIEKVFCERCPFSLIVEPEYVEASESKVRKNSEIRIMQEAAHVIEQSSFGQQQEEPDQFLEEGAGTASEALKEEEKKDASAGKAPAEEKKSPKGQKEEKGKDGKGRKSFGKGERSFGDYKRSIKRSDNPDVLYGRDFDDETIPLESVQTEMGEVCIRGQIMTLETREIRNEKTIIIFAVTDFTDSITVKMFARNDQVEEILAGVKEKAFLKLKGVTTIDRYDSELTIGSVVGIKKIAPFTSSRADTSPEKRVELHCHTKMSDMDGVSDAKAIIKRAYEWGHRAIAITDHGVVQAFPEANHCFDSWGGVVPPDADFKVIYGVEAYLVDDMKGIVQNSKGQSMRGTFVVFDIETTGFSALRDKIIEIGAVRVEDGKIVGRFSEFVNPRIPIPF